MSRNIRGGQIALGAFYSLIAGLVLIGIWQGIELIQERVKWEPIVVTVHCDGERIIEVTPPGKLNSYYPTLHIQDNIKGVSWYDGTNAKHWVDVSHCDSIRIKPWKTVPVTE